MNYIEGFGIARNQVIAVLSMLEKNRNGLHLLISSYQPNYICIFKGRIKDVYLSI